MKPRSDKLAVLHILEATTGGTRRHLVDLTTALDRETFDVSVICATERDKAFLLDIDRMRAAGVDVTVIPMVRNISPVRDTVAFTRILDLLKQRSFDIVHTHSSKAGFLGRLAARLARVPATVHSPHVFAFQMDVHPAVRSLYFRLEKLVASRTDRFICVCANEKQIAVDAGLASPEKFTVIPNGISGPASGTTASAPDLGFGPNHVIIGTVGRLTRQKGLVNLVCAAKSVIDHVPQARFILVGTGELKARLESLIHELSLDGKVRIIDVKDGFESFYPLIDIFVLPSVWEGMPYALLEAMSHSNAIVATRVGGVPEAVHDGKSGLLVPPADPAALAIALVRLARDPDLRAGLGKNAKESAAANFSLERMVRQTEDLYHRLGAEPVTAP